MSEESVVKLKDNFRKDLLKGNYKKALKIYDKLVESDPTLKESFYSYLFKGFLIYLCEGEERAKDVFFKIYGSILPKWNPELIGSFAKVLERHFGYSESASRERVSLDDLVSTFPFFEELPSSALEDIVNIMKPVHYRKGDYLCREGDIGDRMYLIVRGEATVSKGGVWLSHLRNGDMLGEMAFFTKDMVRKADVMAVTDLEAYEISYDDLSKVIERFPGLKDLMYNLFVKRLKESIVATCEVFKSIKPKFKRKLAEKGELLTLKKGDVVTKGDGEDPFFIVSSGEVLVFREDSPFKMGEGSILGGPNFPYRSVVESNESELLKIQVGDLKDALKSYTEILEELESGAFSRGGL